MTGKKQAVKVLVIDVLKPHKPSIVGFAQELCSEKSVQNANIAVTAIDEKTETVKVTLEGTSINFDAVSATVEEFGAVIHSVDKVIVGKRKVIEVPQIDRKE